MSQTTHAKTPATPPAETGSDTTADPTAEGRGFQPFSRRGAGLALGFLTRLPVPAINAPPGSLARVLWAFPLVGALIGGIGGIVFWGLAAIGLPVAAAAVLAVAAMILATGGLHEDGFADVADGLGGGTARADKLAIMRDSRIGSYGVLALALAILCKVVLLAALGETPILALLAPPIAATAGRMICGAAMMLPPARPDGLGARAGQARSADAGLALLVGGLLLAGFAMIWPAGPIPLAASALGAGLAGLAVTGLAWRHLRGQTGDVIGAQIVAAETGALIGLALAIPAAP